MSKRWADQAAVDAQKKAVAGLPAATDSTGLSEAEATGRKGELLNNGTKIPWPKWLEGRTGPNRIVHAHGFLGKDGGYSAVIDASFPGHARRGCNADASAGHDDAGDARNAQATVSRRSLRP